MVDDRFGDEDVSERPWADEDTTVRFGHVSPELGQASLSVDRLVDIRFGEGGRMVLSDGGVSDEAAVVFPSRFGPASVAAFHQAGVDGATIETVLAEIAVALRQRADQTVPDHGDRMRQVASTLLLRAELPEDGPELFDLYRQALDFLSDRGLDSGLGDVDGVEADSGTGSGSRRGWLRGRRRGG